MLILRPLSPPESAFPDFPEAGTPSPPQCFPELPDVKQRYFPPALFHNLSAIFGDADVGIWVLRDQPHILQPAQHAADTGFFNAKLPRHIRTADLISVIQSPQRHHILHL